MDDHHDHDAHNESQGNLDANNHEGMSPYLFIRKSGFFVLFEDARIESDGAFVGALILALLFALIATILSQVIHVYEREAIVSKKAMMKVVSATLFAFRQLLHYGAMLVVMTMSVWLILAVVVGHAFGWLLYVFLFGNRAAQTTTAPNKLEELEA